VHRDRRQDCRLSQSAAGRQLAVIVAVAVNGDGRREVLGIAIGASDAETVWTEFLRSLVMRGLRGVKPVISDTHEGATDIANWGPVQCDRALNSLRDIP
jgi:transposase-like protein